MGDPAGGVELGIGVASSHLLGMISFLGVEIISVTSGTRYQHQHGPPPPSLIARDSKTSKKGIRKQPMFELTFN